MKTSQNDLHRPRLFALLVSLLLALAVGHTLWTTSLDSFTFDEPYHIAAGATYLRFGDFRVNPEHPPLVKLVAALAEPASVLHLDPPGIVEDKYAERIYTQTAVFLRSDARSVQLRARCALILFNTLLLAVLTYLLRRVFSPRIALGTLLLLALDPTISAHMPVVMTDLPLALLGTICCALAVLALRCRRWRDWTALGVGCGLLLATKHSAPLILLPLLAGTATVILWQALRQRRPDALPQLLRLALACALSVLVLWSAYGFRFHESRERDPQGRYIETFNRSFDDKVNDLRSPFFRYTLHKAVQLHLAPRPYLWGMADTLRAGVEGRPMPIAAFHREFYDKAPSWVAFALLFAKLPLGFVCLALAGLSLLGLRRLPPQTTSPLAAFAAMLIVFMAAIAKNGIFYAGVRHWLFAIPLLAVAAAACSVLCIDDRRLIVRLLPIAAILWIALDVLPQRRIWEYHNALAGGSRNAWLGFANESVDMGQRSRELIAFTRANISPAQPLYDYTTVRQELEAAGIHRRQPRPEEVADGYIDGWMIFRALELPLDNWHGVEALRNIQPTARFGDAFIYRGRFYMPLVAAGVLTGRAMREMNEPHGDRALAEDYFRRAARMAPDDDFVAFLELGNISLERHQNAQALDLYRNALKAEKHSAQIQADLQHQIDLILRDPNGTIPILRFGKE